MRLLVMGIYVDFYDEEHQVNGSIVLQDTAGFTMKHQGYFSIDDIKKSLQMWQVYCKLMNIVIQKPCLGHACNTT